MFHELEFDYIHILTLRQLKIVIPLQQITSDWIIALRYGYAK